MDRNTDWLSSTGISGQMPERSGGGLLVASFGQGLKVALNVSATLILVRILPPADFGIAAMASILMNFVLIFKDFGLSVATVQVENLSHRAVSSLFWVTQICGVGFAAISVGLSPALSWAFGQPELTDAFLVLSFGFLFSALAAQHSALLSRQLRFSTLAVIEIVSLFAGLAIAIILADAGFGWWSLIWQRLIQTVLSALAAWVACSWRPSFVFDLSGVRPYLALGAHISGANFAGYLSRNADNAVIGWFWGPAALGFYSKAYDLVMAPLVHVSTPLGQVVQPTLARLGSETTEVRDFLGNILTGALLITMPVGALMVTHSELVTKVILGEAWMQTAPVIAWFGLLVCFHLSGSIFNWILIWRERGVVLSRTATVNAIVNVTLFVVSVPFGMVTVAAAYTVAGLLFRTPYLFFNCTENDLFLRRRLLVAFRLPAAAVVLLTIFYWIVGGIAQNLDIPGSVFFLILLVCGYLLLSLLVLSTTFGRNLVRGLAAIVGSH